MDFEKKMISTIPKQGYVLSCSIVFSDRPEPVLPANKQPISSRNYKRSLIGAITTVLISITIVGIVILNNQNNHAAALTARGAQLSEADLQTNTVDYPRIKAHDLDNRWNSIRTADGNGNQYLLEVYGDERPRLFINDKLIVNTEAYTGLIRHLEKILWSRGQKSR
ncbi:MAG TPA: hypothetical protein VHE59_14505 [Mucilaginibacter sp.]|nr:hypothetical protein [Mucilaginibacter sp.]